MLNQYKRTIKRKPLSPKLQTDQEKILKYMSTNERLERKKFYWQLELLDFAENLEENTIPKKEKKLNNNAKK